MPIIIPKDIPAYSTLLSENIFVMNHERAMTQDIRPIEIAILNLMPTKIETETQLIRLLSNSPLQIKVTLIGTETYVGKNTSLGHLQRFYKTFSEIKDTHFDGMIITGAPVEMMDFSEVKYWKELTEILDYASKNVQSTIFICWGAQAALHYYYGLNKHVLDKKLFGIFKHQKYVQFDPLLKGTDEEFYMPHSRHTTVHADDIRGVEDLLLLAGSDEVGASIARSRDGRRIFLMGHMEYDRDTLKREYLRDIEKGLDIEEPKNYFRDKEKTKIVPNWYSVANLIYSNWLNYYVYQMTPYDIKGITQREN
ncbi:MAG: homoserine O-succinyltransferase [Clostridia bacterium]|nr:homoserine O-succinyltransferase [Clostridia bacterium]MBQ7788270.1 homoserine O-succinyltransferase [Clostridia bacterium]